MNTQPSLPGRDRRADAPAARRTVTPLRIDACVDAFARGEFDRAAAVLGRMCEAAAPLEACERALLPVARGLGDRWVADTCDFATLTLAMTRLHALLHRIGRRWSPETPARRPRRALIAAAPGEQHIFGAAMLAEAFRGAGWEVCAPQGASARDIVTRARSGGYEIVGLSLACDAGLEGLGRLVGDLRAPGRGVVPPVIVGGRPFVEQPALAKMIGADGSAADCAGALALADALAGELRAAA